MKKRPCSDLKLSATSTGSWAAQQKAQSNSRPEAAYWLLIDSEAKVVLELGEVGSKRVTRVGQVVFPRLVHLIFTASTKPVATFKSLRSL